METTDLQRTPEQGMQKPTNPLALTVSTNDIKQRMHAIKECLEDVMQEGIHYGEIPGTGKPTMLKPGAELVCAMFQLDPQPKVEIDDLGDGHREYRVTGSLYSMATGKRVGGGVGSCCTMEKKYRYRKNDRVTDVPLPSGFWDTYDKSKGETMADADFSMLLEELHRHGEDVPSGAEAGVTKDDGAWVITIKERGENPDIADVYNTVLKMAKKRWLVDATLTATGASALFTQDLEDLPDFHYTPTQRPMDVKSTEVEPADERSRHAPLPDMTAVLPGDYPARVGGLDSWLADHDEEDLPAALEKATKKINDWPKKAWNIASEVIDWHQQNRT